MGEFAAAQAASFAQIAPEEEIKAAVEEKLNISQKIEIPVVADSQIKISSAAGKAALQNYMNASGPVFDKLKSVTDSAIDDIYNQEGSINKISS